MGLDVGADHQPEIRAGIGRCRSARPAISDRHIGAADSVRGEQLAGPGGVVVPPRLPVVGRRRVIKRRRRATHPRSSVTWTCSFSFDGNVIFLPSTCTSNSATYLPTVSVSVPDHR